MTKGPDYRPFFLRHLKYQHSTLTEPINFAAVYPTGYACESAAGCSAYSLIYQDMPSEVCVALIPMVEGRSSRVRIRGAQNIVVKGNPLPGETSPVAVYDPARMVEACNGADRVLVALISEK